MLKYQEIITKMTLTEKIAFCSGADFWTTKAYPHHNIPSICMTDGPHGLRKQINNSDNLGIDVSVPATCFPAACASACSWDATLLKKMGAAIAEEALQEGISIVLGPGVNMKRNPLCGRNFEYFSEDPLLAGELASAWIQGAEGMGVGTSLKHFAANSQEDQRLASDSIMDARALHEIYLPAFEKAVKAGNPSTVMCAYNKINGIYCSDNAWLLTQILREMWGYQGIVVTDWGAMNNRTQAFKAGCDLEMPGGAAYFDATVLADVQAARLAEQDIDVCVDRLLDLVYRCDKNRKPGFSYDVAAHHQLARQIAAESAVLLKNDTQTLPLKKTQKIALIGALAEKPRFQGAGSSFINPTRLSNALTGMAELGFTCEYAPGYALNDVEDAALLADAVNLAKNVDVAIIFVGLTDDYESEGFDRSNLDMPKNHNLLIEAVCAVNPNVVVVLSCGAPVVMPWLERVKAVLHMGLAGQAFGLAVADLLSGAANPCGKLAETYPLRYEDVPSAGVYEHGGQQAQYRESIYIGYRYYDKAEKAVCFPFGYGLSYTQFAYTNLNLAQQQISAEDGVTLTFNVKNTGQVKGAEICQVYVHDLTQQVHRPLKELKAFQKVTLNPGEEKQVCITLDRRAFAIYSPEANTWLVPSGSFIISIGASSRDLRLQAGLDVKGDATLPQSKTTPPGWYLKPSGTPTQTDFETLLGRKIEPTSKPVKGSYSVAHTLQDMQASPIIRLITRIIKRKVIKDYGIEDYSNPNFRMVMESVTNVPLRSLVLISDGGMSANMAHGMVEMANGRVFKGLKLLLKK